MRSSIPYQPNDAATIQSIRMVKKPAESCFLVLDNGDEVLLRLEVVLAARLEKGQKLTIAQMEDLLRADAESRCRLAAWRLLNVRPRSETELRRALRQRQHLTPAIDGIVAELKEKGFLDDQSFAQGFVQQRTARRQGPRLIQQELKTRGVARPVVQEVMDGAVSDDKQREDMEVLLTRWNRRSKPEDAKKRAQVAAAYLLRRGFDPALVWPAIRAFFGRVVEQDEEPAP